MSRLLVLLVALLCVGTVFGDRISHFVGGSFVSADSTENYIVGRYVDADKAWRRSAFTSGAAMKWPVFSGKKMFYVESGTSDVVKVYDADALSIQPLGQRFAAAAITGLTLNGDELTITGTFATGGATDDHQNIKNIAVRSVGANPLDVWTKPAGDFQPAAYADVQNPAGMTKLWKFGSTVLGLDNTGKPWYKSGANWAQNIIATPLTGVTTNLPDAALLTDFQVVNGKIYAYFSTGITLNTETNVNHWIRTDNGLTWTGMGRIEPTTTLSYTLPAAKLGWSVDDGANTIYILSTKTDTSVVTSGVSSTRVFKFPAAAGAAVSISPASSDYLSATPTAIRVLGGNVYVFGNGYALGTLAGDESIDNYYHSYKRTDTNVHVVPTSGGALTPALGGGLTVGAGGYTTFYLYNDGEATWFVNSALTTTSNLAAYGLIGYSENDQQWRSVGNPLRDNVAARGSVYPGFPTDNGVVSAVLQYQGSSGRMVAIGGIMATYNNASIMSVATSVNEDGQEFAWTALGAGLSSGQAVLVNGRDTIISQGPGQVNALAFVESSGKWLIAGGSFLRSDNVYLNNIGKFNTDGGSAWEPLGAGVTGEVVTLSAYNSVVFVGGSFIVNDGNNSVNNFAKWDESKGAWQSVGLGVVGTVKSVLATGADSALIAGSITSAGGTVLPGIVESIVLYEGGVYKRVPCRFCSNPDCKENYYPQGATCEISGDGKELAKVGGIIYLRTSTDTYMYKDGFFQTVNGGFSVGDGNLVARAPSKSGYHVFSSGLSNALNGYLTGRKNMGYFNRDNLNWADVHEGGIIGGSIVVVNSAASSVFSVVVIAIALFVTLF